MLTFLKIQVLTTTSTMIREATLPAYKLLLPLPNNLPTTAAVDEPSEKHKIRTYVTRPPDKSALLKIIFLISQPKHVLWVLKRTVLIR